MTTIDGHYSTLAVALRLARSAVDIPLDGDVSELVEQTNSVMDVLPESERRRLVGLLVVTIADLAARLPAGQVEEFKAGVGALPMRDGLGGRCDVR